MSRLALNSLEIRGYRCFDHLHIERLGRVNLIVGKNNVGKSTLLEALELYSQRAHPNLIWQILVAHDEQPRDPAQNEIYERKADYDYDELLSAIKYLFYGRKNIEGENQPIQIGPLNIPKELLSLKISTDVPNKDDQAQLQQPLPLFQKDTAFFDSALAHLYVQLGDADIHYPLPSRLSRRLPLKPEFKELNYIAINANGLNRRRFGELWDKIALTNYEKEVLSALRIIAPGITAINIVGGPALSQERMPIVKVESMPDPLPLRSLGDGIQRMLGIALALVNAKDGLLLIDEVENGLHYTVQQKLWKLIFELARKLNVQIFATSHSWDCIEAFQKVAQDDQEEAMLIRLESKKGAIHAVSFNKQNLEIAAREQIEVR